MNAGPMTLADALRVVHASRGETDVVIATMGAAREWMAISRHPLDWIFVPSSMGQATSLGLGLALARPDRRVIVLNGDGSMLMNLGSLVTITAEAPANLAILLLDNGAYEVTGAQPTPGAPGARAGRDRLDFGAVANACGFRSVYRFARQEEWARDAATVLAGPGPTFVHLDVQADPAAGAPRSPGPAPERARRFMAALGS
jgi:thiamine pyrophosphate-dependent acetolactate synthase large subunit-like protein